ncbi:GNAT family N-acetyltransferase [Spirillospora sp. NPDC048819]|uniref:GNAT family N-acetyltransferase n=1 Tax=Spirillospora sp. NPDC048819 TaxID=3155268 RepID=UPI0033DC1485
MITTPRLLLRSLRLREGRLAQAIGSDPEAQRWLGWRPKSLVPEDERGRLLAVPASGGRSRFGLPGRYVETGMLAIDPDGGLAAGVVTLTPVSEDLCELGGYLAPAYRGRGLGAELFAAGLALAQQHLHVTEVRAGVEPENVASVRSLWRAGLDPIPGPQSHRLSDGRVIPAAWYSDVSPNPGWCASAW